MIVVELTAAIDAIGTTQTFYMSDEAFVTSATDTPKHTAFNPRLIDPGDIDVSIYRDGPSGGASTLEFGEILLANIDGELDVWKRYSFDGRPLVIRIGDGGAYPGDFVTVFNGTVASATISWEQVILDIRDKAYVFSLPILSDRFLGNNVLPNGVQGTPNDVGGSLIPLCIGDVQEIAPPCVNTSLLIYKVNKARVSSIFPVYVRQEPLIKDLDYSTNLLLQQATVPGGHYATCLNEGLFRVGGQDGQVTCNVSEATGRSIGQVLLFLAQLAGIPYIQINTLEVQGLDLKQPSQLGIYIDDDSTYIDVMNKFAQSVGAWFAFDNLGILRMGRLETPSSHPIDVLQQFDILTPPERTILQNEPTPIWSVALNHTLIYTVQTSGLVGDITPARQAFLSEQYRTATYQNPAVQTQFQLATSITVDTLLTNATDATNEALRVQTLHGQVYDVFNIPMDVSRFTELVGKGLWLGKELGLDLPRFDLEGGFSFVVLGISYQRAAKRIVCTLWGGNVPALAIPVTVEAIGRAAGIGDAFEQSIFSMAGRATGSGSAQANVGGVQSASGQAIGTGTANSSSGTITGTQGQPFGFLLLLTRAT